ncbi:hypothetical protein DENSPDRAFT_108969 [Dentipellis sp. KUC8613]|nr:hypothetical protein DENSPDRAFT_108969 [Dentipellis sp. KUC8613]
MLHALSYCMRPSNGAGCAPRRCPAHPLTAPSAVSTPRAPYGSPRALAMTQAVCCASSRLAPSALSYARGPLARPCSCPSTSAFVCARRLCAVPLARLSLSHCPCRFTS